MKIIKEKDDLKIYYDGKKYTVNYKNRVLLTCLKGYPNLINEDLIIVNEDIINIYQNIRQGLKSTSIICKQGIVVAKPMLFKDLIIVVFKNGIVQFDLDLNVIKKIDCNMEGTITQEKIVNNKYFTFVINVDNKSTKVYYNIQENSILQEQDEYDKMLTRS